jgi:hypothetical protein
MEFANAANINRKSGERSGGTCCAPTRQTKALQVSLQILPKHLFFGPPSPSLPLITAKHIFERQNALEDALAGAILNW